MDYCSFRPCSCGVEDALRYSYPLASWGRSNSLIAQDGQQRHIQGVSTVSSMQYLHKPTVHHTQVWRPCHWRDAELNLVRIPFLVLSYRLGLLLQVRILGYAMLRICYGLQEVCPCNIHARQRIHDGMLTVSFRDSLLLKLLVSDSPHDHVLLTQFFAGRVFTHRRHARYWLHNCNTIRLPYYSLW
jgi:hypothetical protein